MLLVNQAMDSNAIHSEKSLIANRIVSVNTEQIVIRKSILQITLYSKVTVGLKAM